MYSLISPPEKVFYKPWLMLWDTLISWFKSFFKFSKVCTCDEVASFLTLRKQNPSADGALTFGLLDCALDKSDPVSTKSFRGPCAASWEDPHLAMIWHREKNVDFWYFNGCNAVFLTVTMLLSEHCSAGNLRHSQVNNGGWFIWTSLWWVDLNPISLKMWTC